MKLLSQQLTCRKLVALLEITNSAYNDVKTVSARKENWPLVVPL
jgi:hypothetical protein